ncbi:MAG: hypothetical protein JWQ49_1578 [Edaphobacter sp.]|nr:hypothetical protein [Edaphobacter sp.]
MLHLDQQALNLHLATGIAIVFQEANRKSRLDESCSYKEFRFEVFEKEALLVRSCWNTKVCAS